MNVNPTIDHNFKYHPPVGPAVDSHQAIRLAAKALAMRIDDLLPHSAAREKALAITKCEEAMMWACAGIARHSETIQTASERRHD